MRLRWVAVDEAVPLQYRDTCSTTEFTESFPNAETISLLWFYDTAKLLVVRNGLTIGYVIHVCIQPERDTLPEHLVSNHLYLLRVAVDRTVVTRNHLIPTTWHGCLGVAVTNQDIAIHCTPPFCSLPYIPLLTPSITVPHPSAAANENIGPIKYTLSHGHHTSLGCCSPILRR